MACRKCGGPITMMVQITMVIPGEMESHLTKKAIASKAVEIWGASWPAATEFCANPKCKYNYRRGSNQEEKEAKWKAELAAETSANQ